MPYGLPGLSKSEHTILMDWIKVGAPHEALDLPEEILAQVSRWEKIFNGDSLKHRLMSRYLYEHLFLNHLYFSDSSDVIYFRLVRSKTPPTEAIEQVTTRHPYDDPKVDRVYYRLQRVTSTVVLKTHIPYVLNDKRHKRLTDLFLTKKYVVKNLPNYNRDISTNLFSVLYDIPTNPFTVFRDIPINSRYRFLLDEAKASISAFIKGPVCRGQVALNVINDNFWGFFVDPDSKLVGSETKFLAQVEENLRLPSEDGSSGFNFLTWYAFADAQKEFLTSKQQWLRKTIVKSDVSLDIVWDGDGDGINDNAALTIFRHFDSGSVVKGMVGNKPKTAWLIGYALLERIHYLISCRI